MEKSIGQREMWDLSSGLSLAVQPERSIRSPHLVADPLNSTMIIVTKKFSKSVASSWGLMLRV